MALAIQHRGQDDAGVKRLLELVTVPDIPQRCAAVADNYFSLDEGVARYQSIYARLDR